MTSDAGPGAGGRLWSTRPSGRNSGEGHGRDRHLQPRDRADGVPGKRLRDGEPALPRGWGSRTAATSSPTIRASPPGRSPSTSDHIPVRHAGRVIGGAGGQSDRRIQRADADRSSATATSSSSGTRTTRRGIRSPARSTRRPAAWCVPISDLAAPADPNDPQVAALAGGGFVVVAAPRLRLLPDLRPGSVSWRARCSPSTDRIPPRPLSPGLPMAASW